MKKQKTTYDKDERYKATVTQISGALIQAGQAATKDPLAAMTLACDVAAEVILAYPPFQQHAVLDVFLTRLGNVLERRTMGTKQ